jgi:hypothetical protein
MRTRLLGSVLLGAALGIAASAAQARTFNVPCNDSALLAALITVNTNGEEDVVWLAESCRYALDVSVVIDPDGGFPEGHPVTIHGRGATLSGSGQRTVVSVDPTAVLSVEGLTVTSGFSTGDGGAIQNLGVLTLTDSVVSDSEALSGGGILNETNGRLTLIRSEVSGNRAESHGAGIRNRGGRVTLIASALTGNRTTGSNPNGGGLYSEGSGARVTLANSTVSGNSSRFGAGLFSDGGTMAVHNCTLSDNRVPDGGNGGALYVRGSSVKLAHSILANSVFELDGGSECVLDLGGAIVPSSPNLVEDGSCTLAGALSGDPLLGPPTGTPAYHPLLPESPAIDAGGNQSCTGTDQRGAPHRDGDGNGLIACDLGSYEAP